MLLHSNDGDVGKQDTFSTIFSHCVPLPAAGAPMIMTFRGVAENDCSSAVRDSMSHPILIRGRPVRQPDQQQVGVSKDTGFGMRACSPSRRPRIFVGWFVSAIAAAEEVPSPLLRLQHSICHAYTVQEGQIPCRHP